jgi:HK97 family phage major capsid protein
MDHFSRAAINATDAALADALVSGRRARDALAMVNPSPRRPEWLPDYSLRRLIAKLAVDDRTGVEFEVSKDFERSQQLTSGGVIVPFEVFARADVVGVSSGGGYLTQALNLPAEDALRPNMVTGALGATIIPAPYGANVNLPRQTGTATASWLPTEATQAAESDQTFGQVTYTPHTVGANTEVSRLSLLQSAPTNIETVVRRDLIAVLGRALDYAALHGSGINGQPLGLAGMGVATFSGTSLALSGVVDAAVALSDALNDSAGIAANRTVAGLLKKRQEASGSTRLMWEGSLVAGTCIGFPARSSTALSAGALFLGSWNYLNVVVWGDGIEVLTNPFDQTNFRKGIVGVRAMLTCDVAPTWAQAFNFSAAVS